MKPEDYLKQVTKNKYAALFGSFLENGVTDVLISLPGLGAFKNNPKMVGEILKELFFDDESPFKGKFQTIKINIFKPENESSTANMVREFIHLFNEQNE